MVPFQRFPEEEVIRCTSKDVVESQFMQMVKEADQIKHRGEIISVMQKKDHKQLWSGLASGKGFIFIFGVWKEPVKAVWGSV